MYASFSPQTAGSCLRCFFVKHFCGIFFPFVVAFGLFGALCMRGRRRADMEHPEKI